MCPFKLAAAAFVVILFPVSALAADADTIVAELEKTKTAYTDAASKARSELITAFDEAEKAIAQTGDLDAVKSLHAERQAFTEKGTLPTAVKMRSAASDFQRVSRQAMTTMDKAYDQAVKELTKAMAIEQAEKVQADWKEFQAHKSPANSTDTKERLLGKIDVSAAGDWQKSVNVHKGDRLRLQASGEWCMNGSRTDIAIYGADGLHRDGTAEAHGLYALLMARIGPHIYLVGRGTEILVDRDAALEFRSNDFNLVDNFGSVSVAIYAMLGN